MNREIKFKVWDLYRCKMKNLKTISFEFTNTKDSLITANSDNGEVTDIGSRFILMQFTGLKDIEGKEIYEGDIILGYNNPHVVTFADGAFYLTYKNSSVRLSRTCGALKIIGNIFENPESSQTTS